jgi:hypothetical protein
MKYVFINPLQLISTLIHAGEITVDQLNEAVRTPRTLNYPCGFNYDDHDHDFAIFFDTDKKSNRVKWCGKDKAHIQLNIRANKKEQVAATPGQVLPATTGAPALGADLIAAVALLQARGLQVSAPATAAVAVATPAPAPAPTPVAEAQAEADFGGVMPDTL